MEEAGCPLGTTMVVRDLFYNTPARLKFMKKDAAEGAAVFAVVQRTALSHPEVSVKFLRDGKQELLTPGTDNCKAPSTPFWAGSWPGLHPGEGLWGGDVGHRLRVQARLLPGQPELAVLFVNGRQVKSRLMLAALEEAYQNQKMVGRFPACVLHLEVKLSAVDVNVHPAKDRGEVRQRAGSVQRRIPCGARRPGGRPHPALGGSGAYPVCLYTCAPLLLWQSPRGQRHLPPAGSP